MFLLHYASRSAALGRSRRSQQNLWRMRRLALGTDHGATLSFIFEYIWYYLNLVDYIRIYSHHFVSFFWSKVHHTCIIIGVHHNRFVPQLLRLVAHMTGIEKEGEQGVWARCKGSLWLSGGMLTPPPHVHTFYIIFSGIFWISLDVCGLMPGDHCRIL